VAERWLDHRKRARSEQLDEMIRREDGRTCRAELVARDHRPDLAILRIPGRALKSAQRRHSTLRTGPVVVAAAPTASESSMRRHMGN